MKEKKNMRFRKGWLGLLCAFLLVMGAACANGDQMGEEGTNNGEQENVEEGGGAEEELELEPGTEEIEFPELDRSHLGADQIVATYQNGEVTGEEFANYLAFLAFLNPQTPINEQEMQQEVINSLIMDKIIAEQTTTEDREWAEEQVDQLWEEINQFYDEEMMAEAYQNLEISEDEIREAIYSFMITTSYFRNQIPEEDRTYADVRHILVSTMDDEEGEGLSEEEALDLANDLYAQLQEGADFAELAEEHTDDPGSQENGGLYEHVNVVQWVPEFRQAALEQEIDEIGEPVLTDHGFHIIRVENREVVPVDEMEEAIAQGLATEKQTEYYYETLPDLIDEINL